MKKRGLTIFALSLGLTSLLLASGRGLRTGAARADSAELWAQMSSRAQALPPEFVEAENKGEARLGERISNTLFDKIGSLDLLAVPFGNGSSVGVHVGRAIYSNHDIEESFTVVDRMSIPVTLPGVTVPIASPLATFNVGIGGSLDFVDLRVVRPSDSFYKDPLIEDILSGNDLETRRSELESSDWLKSAQAQLKDDQKGYLEGPADQDRPVLLLDSLRNARYGRVWNLVAAPLRLPLRAEWLSHLADEEVMSYAGSGTIEVGPTVGLSTSLQAGTNRELNLGASIRAYLRGDFRISIMKVADKRARVKVSREFTRGMNGTLGGSTSGTFYDGFVIAGSIAGHDVSKTLYKIDQALIPISFGGDSSLGHSFEVGYEYDLTDARAIEAYEQAVTGRLALSDEIANETRDESAKAPVRKTFRREADLATDSQNIGLNLRLIAREGGGSYAVQDAVIELPDGTSHVVKARTDVSFQSKFSFLLFTSTASVNYSIRTDLIENLRDPDEDALYGWIAEIQIQDNDTTGYELNRYSDMVQTLFTDKKLFPTVPVSVPSAQRTDPVDGDDSDVSAEALTRYGNSSFFVRIGLTSDQLLKLALAPQEKMWSYLEAGFERPEGSWTKGWMRPLAEAGGWLYDLLEWMFKSGQIDQRLGPRFFHAKTFRNDWIEAQALAQASVQGGVAKMTNSQREAFARAIGKMYSDRTFAYEIIKTTLLALRDLGENGISYQVNAQTNAFPGIDLKGGSITEIEKESSAYAKTTDWDQRASRQDLTLEASSMSARVTDPDHVEIHFTASRAPTHVILKLDQLSTILRLSETRRRLLVKNTGQFHAGENVLRLDRHGNPGYETDLAQAIEPNANYRLTLALMDGEAVGIAASVEFYTNPLRGSPAPSPR